MRTENIYVEITIPIPFDTPDMNGTVRTKEAVTKAVDNLCKNIPIVYKDGENDKVIGTTVGTPHTLAWNLKDKICEVSISGVVFYGGANVVVNEIKDGVITDFRITGVGLSI